MTLRALAERLEKAKGSDRDLNLALYAALWEGFPISEEIAERRWQAYRDFTGSLDAALALVERALPGWGWSVADYKTQSGTCIAFLHDPDKNACDNADAPTPALALCLALVKARASEEETK